MWPIRRLIKNSNAIAQEATTQMCKRTSRRSDVAIPHLGRNPKGHSNYKFIPSLLVASVSKDTLRSSRLDLNLNLNVAAEIRIIKGHKQIAFGGHHHVSHKVIQ